MITLPNGFAFSGEMIFSLYQYVRHLEGSQNFGSKNSEIEFSFIFKRSA